MNYRTFGRTGWKVSEIGYGMWGMGEWTGSDDEQSARALDLAVELGCTFFDTAWVYGRGKSEGLLGDLLRRHPRKRLYVATKIPPKNFAWPARKEYTLDDCFPPDHIEEYADRSLKNLGTDAIDLLQFHVWNDTWARDDRWAGMIEQLKADGRIRAAGISINRWDPDNSLETLKTGVVDSVQVVYNIFDQAPEDNLFPLCAERNIAVIARVPFDEGTLTGAITRDTTFPENDWRHKYFNPEHLAASVEHADRLRPSIPEGMTMPEMALRFILSHPTVSTTIPGMRKPVHVRANIAAGEGRGLPQELLREIRNHRWDRFPR